MINTLANETAYGDLYEDSVGSTITTTVAGTYYGWVTATANGHNQLVLDTTSVTADNMTVPIGAAGTYLVSFSVSYFTTNNNVTSHWCVHLNGNPVANINCERKFINGGYIAASSVTGLLALAIGDIIDLRVTSDNAGEIITVKHVSFIATRISK